MIPNYDGIPRAEDAEHYLETALRRGDTRARSVKGIRDRLLLVKAREKDRLRMLRDSLKKNLMNLHDSFPSFDQMSEFSLRVFKLDMDPGRAKQALGGVHSAVHNIEKLTQDHLERIHRADREDYVIKASKACLGRVSSIVKQAKKHFRVLNEARLVFRSMPAVDEELFTVAIAGFPNVGKSTLLKKITGAKPEIKSYAFTTKGLNAGFFEYHYNKIQCIDTPGTLNRKSMNDIEKKADIAIRYLADTIVYVFDPTEASYPLQKQKELYEVLKKMDKDVFVYVSKTDIATKKQIESVEGYNSAEELKKILGKAFRKWV